MPSHPKNGPLRFQQIHGDNGPGCGILAGPVKSTEYPDTDERTVPFPPAEKETAIVPKSPDAGHRYVDVPVEPMPPIAKRNLTFGIVFIVLAAIGLWLGLYYAGATAARTVVASLGACGLALLLAQRRVLAQKHGILLTLGAAALFGAAIPWVEGSFRKIDGIAREKLGDAPEPIVRTALPPPPTADNAPPAPPTIAIPDSEETEEAAANKKPALVMRPSKEEQPQEPVTAKLATEDTRPATELVVLQPDKGAGKLISLKEDMKVEIAGRPMIIRAGTLAPFKELVDGKVIFLANENEVSIDMEHVKFTGVSKEPPPAEVTKWAQREAVLLYPKLAEEDSLENRTFLARQKELALEPDGREFLKNPQWPLLLAKEIAAQEHWVSTLDAAAGAKPGDAPAPADAPVVPANEAPANELLDKVAPPELPPLQDDLPPPTIPQENVPPPVKTNGKPNSKR